MDNLRWTKTCFRLFDFSQRPQTCYLAGMLPLFFPFLSHPTHLAFGHAAACKNLGFSFAYLPFCLNCIFEMPSKSASNLSLNKIAFELLPRATTYVVRGVLQGAHQYPSKLECSERALKMSHDLGKNRQICKQRWLTSILHP